MTARILILHTSVGLEEASGLVDLIEASLPLASGDIACSSLPGYALPAGVGPSQLEGIAAALVLVDEPALHDSQLWFEAGGVWALGKRVVLLLDSPEWLAQVPAQLKNAHVTAREDRAALVSLVEDLAFTLGVDPRFGSDAMRVLDQLGSAPPPRMPPAGDDFLDLGDDTPVGGPPEDTQESIPPLPEPAIADSFEPGPAYYASQDDEPLELSDADMVSIVPEAPGPRPSHFAPRLRCAAAFEAGAAISTCSFHRDSNRDFATELDDTFGRFIDAVGGNWSQLSRLSDVEVWLGAIDNLLEGLAPAQRKYAEWYEIGFQFSTLRIIAEQGMPADMEQRAVYQELWMQSLSQFRASTTNVGVTPRDIRRLQSQLENLIGPAHKRDAVNLTRVLGQLHMIAETRDDEALQHDEQAVG